MTLRLPLALTGHRTRVSAHCGLSVNLGNIWNRQQCSFVAVYRMLLKLCSWKSFIFHTKNQINSKAYILNPNIELGKATVISYVSRLSFVIIDICIAAILLFLWHWNVQIQWNSPHIEFLVFFSSFSLRKTYTTLVPNYLHDYQNFMNIYSFALVYFNLSRLIKSNLYQHGAISQTYDLKIKV